MATNRLKNEHYRGPPVMPLEKNDRQPLVLSLGLHSPAVLGQGFKKTLVRKKSGIILGAAAPARAMGMMGHSFAG